MMAGAMELLDHLHRGGVFAYWWTPDGEPFTGRDGQQHRAKVSVWYPVGRRCEIPRSWSGKNVYWAVHPCTAIPPTNALGQERRPHQVRAQLPYVAAINCLFAEFDGGADDALAHLGRLWNDGYPYPTATIHSGGGVHAYWLLEDTLPVTDANRAQVAHWQAAWVDLVGADDGAKDLARVLRVPGTENRKPQRQLPDGSFPKVTVIEYRPMRMYGLEELTRFLPAYKPPAARPAAEHTATGDRMAGAADSLVTAARCLQRLDSDDYAQWVNVGMALKTSLGDTAGYALWRNWSARSCKYDEGECRKKWDKLPSDSTLTLGSVVFWAQGGGR